MAELKKCVQCNELKSVEDFREYTHSRNKQSKTKASRYRICRDCENINTRYYRAKAVIDSYMTRPCLDSKAIKAGEELEKIQELYEALEARGCRTPLSKEEPKTTVLDDVDRLLEKLKLEEKALPVVGKKIVTQEPIKPDEIPSELQYWLGDEWKAAGQTPEFYQETIYESLKAKYRPQIGVDKERGTIVYDDTYKTVLNDILRKFDDYEDNYEEAEDE